MYKRIISLSVLFFLLGASSRSRAAEVLSTETFDGGGDVRVSALDSFARGADLSVLKKIEDSGGIYKQDNIPKDALIIFKNHGFNWLRLRLFHTPSGEGPVCNDLPYTTALAQRFKAQGFKFLLDFHYSDTWADPGNQDIPAAWVGL
ncbi:MAG: glycosyl hydrolase 53 family protein, partial [Planctomycetota bacterium]